MALEEKVTILVADDDPYVRQSLSIYLKREGYTVIYAEDGDAAVEQCLQQNPTLMLLDVMMPRRDGLEVCREVRKTMQLPIIMLSARDDEIDKLIGLELGADDYVTKPFSPREVVARIKAVLRRINYAEEPAAQAVPDLKLGSLVISPARRLVTLADEEISLTPKEFDILYMLGSNPGRVYSREQLLAGIWGYDFMGDTRAVDTHVKRIRSKISAAQGIVLRTVWGIGYCIDIKNETAEA